MTRIAAAVVCAFVLAGCGAAPPAALRDGDIIFHTSRSAQSLAIQRATHSPYSHMGLILYRNGQPYVFEAVGPVRCTHSGAGSAGGSVGTT